MSNPALNIDLTDPSVQHMLGGPSRLATGKREVVQLAGDVPDPTGLSARRGFQSTTHLTAGKQEVVVVYKGLFLTVDLYVLGAQVTAYLHCPRCRNVLTVRGDRKAIDFDPLAVSPVRVEVAGAGDPVLALAGQFGRLSIEPFECTWEITGGPHVAGGHHTGVSLCRMRMAIDDNRAKDA